MKKIAASLLLLAGATIGVVAPHLVRDASAGSQTITVTAPPKFDLGQFSEDLIAAGYRDRGTPGDPVCEGSIVTVAVKDGVTREQVEALLVGNDGRDAADKELDELFAIEKDWDKPMTALKKDDTLRKVVRVLIRRLRRKN